DRDGDACSIALPAPPSRRRPEQREAPAPVRAKAQSRRDQRARGQPEELRLPADLDEWTIRERRARQRYGGAPDPRPDVREGRAREPATARVTGPPHRRSPRWRRGGPRLRQRRFRRRSTRPCRRTTRREARAATAARLELVQAPRPRG